MSATNRFRYVNLEKIARQVAEDPGAMPAPKKERTPEEIFAAAVSKVSAQTGVSAEIVAKILTAVAPKKTPRARGDFYETPAWCVEAVLGELPRVTAAGDPVIVDAGAGTGAISAVLSAAAPRAEIVGVEKFPELVAQARARGLRNAEFVQGNFLRWEPELARPDVIVMNPPYSFAQQFVEHALRLVRRGGTVAALLRSNWLASKCRREFHRKHPADVYILTKRPSFTGGGTDATDYAWFVWGPERGHRWELLNHEGRPVHDRAADHP